MDDERYTRDELKQLAERHEMTIATDGLTMILVPRDMAMIVYALKFTAKNSPDVL